MDHKTEHQTQNKTFMVVAMWLLIAFVYIAAVTGLAYWIEKSNPKYQHCIGYINTDQSYYEDWSFTKNPEIRYWACMIDEKGRVSLKPLKPEER